MHFRRRSPLLQRPQRHLLQRTEPKMNKGLFFFGLLRGHRLLQSLGLTDVEIKLLISTLRGSWTYRALKEGVRQIFAAGGPAQPAETTDQT